MPKVETDLELRWKRGYLHDERSEELVNSLLELDEKHGHHSLAAPGNADYLMYLLDIHFEMQDIT